MTAKVMDVANNGVPGVPVTFLCTECENDYGQAITDMNGFAVMTTYTGSFSSCATFEIYAYTMTTPILQSNHIRCQALGPCGGTTSVATRMSVFCPTTASFGENLNITAFLEYQSGANWLPLPNANVTITKKIGSGASTVLKTGATGADGRLNANDVAPTTPSTITYTANFATGTFSASLTVLPNWVAPVVVLALLGGLLYFRR